MENGTLTIALLGQPNSGKSSVFNGLTGAHQHVGNWPGKTVEHKSGSFTQNGTDYAVVDLPGSYSLSAGSQEEVVTTSYIRSGKADLVAILVDSSQLERSLYMLADFIGTRIPAVLILNLMDVAEQKGVKIDTAKLSARLGIPVIGFVAADRKRYPALKAQLADAAAKSSCCARMRSCSITAPTLPSALPRWQTAKRKAASTRRKSRPSSRWRSRTRP